MGGERKGMRYRGPHQHKHQNPNPKNYPNKKKKTTPHKKKNTKPRREGSVWYGGKKGGIGNQLNPWILASVVLRLATKWDTRAGKKPVPSSGGEKRPIEQRRGAGTTPFGQKKFTGGAHS